MYTKYVTSHYLLFGVSEKSEVKMITILYQTYAVTDFIKQAYFQTDFRVISENKYRKLSDIDKIVHYKFLSLQEEKEEIWRSPMTKALMSAEISKGQHDITKTSTNSRLPSDWGPT